MQRCSEVVLRCSRYATLCGVLSLLAAVLAPACQRPGGVLASCSDCDLVMIALTNVRADRVGWLGYQRPTTPHLDRFLAGAQVFERAYTPASWTLPAAVSIATSLYPFRHGVLQRDVTHGPPATPPTLAEVLAAHGFATAAFTGSGDYHRRYGLGRGFATYLDEEAGAPIGLAPRLEPRRGQLWQYWRMADVEPLAREWLAAPRSGRRFLYVQAYDAHCPYAPRPEYLRRFSAGYTGAVDFTRCLWSEGPAPRVVHDGTSGWQVTTDCALPQARGRREDRCGLWIGPADRRELSDRYDAEIAELDASLAPLLALLATPAVAARTVVVVLAEHGEILGEHDVFTRSGPVRGTFYEPVLRVPLAIHLPGSTGARHGALLDLVDLLPTVLELLGVSDPAPAAREGLSFAAYLRGRGPAPRATSLSGARFIPAAAEPGQDASASRAIRRAGYKLLVEQRYDPRDGTLRDERQQLFSLGADPAEAVDLSRAQPELAAALRAELERAMPSHALRAGRR